MMHGVKDRAIVMELAEGQCPAGPLHRDLKPANIADPGRPCSDVQPKKRQ